MIFNSLGSNYSLGFALKFLRARTSINTDERLKEFLNQKYGGQTWLYYKGRSALSEAVRLCQADKVLTSGFSCYAVEQAIKSAGSQPVFTDIDTKTLNFSLKHLKDTHRANPRIKAVILQNTFGIGIDISQIANYCRRHKLYIIEDLAHCPNNQYADGTNFGQIGDLVVLSFGRDKQIDAVNGGALIVRNLDLAEKVVAPQPILNQWRWRFSDRLGPLLFTWVRFCYSKSLGGRAWYKTFNYLGLLTLVNDEPVFHGGALPSYRSEFILNQFQNIEEDCRRRRRLMGIYDVLQSAELGIAGEQPLLRYPILLSSKKVKASMLEKLKEKDFHFADNWYDDYVYPSRFSEISSYKIGSCANKEKITGRIVNLPLHENMTPALARELVEIASPYIGGRFKTKFTAESWQATCREFDSQGRNLLSSYEEVEAHKAVGRKVWRFAVYKDGRIISLTAAILIRAKKGRFLKVAGSPLFKNRDPILQSLVIQRLKEIALKERCSFIRIQTFLLDTVESRQFIKDLKLRSSPANLTAPSTLKTDLDQPSEKILSSRHYRNTRNRINQAKRLNLRVLEKNTQRSLEDFLRLLKLTQRDQDFVSAPFSFIRAQFKAYKKSNKVHLYQVLNASDSDNPNEILAGAFVVDDDLEAAYLYGASSKNGQKLRAAYILQWQIILDAQQRGLKAYNLWGVSPPQASENHRFAQLTRFKKNFASERYDYLPSHDLVLKKFFYLSVSYWKLTKPKNAIFDFV